jgi:hypothetical protein
MATTLQHKRSSTSGHIPSTSSLALGEIAINTVDGYLYIKTSDGINPEEIYRLRGTPLSDVAVTLNTFTGDGSTTNFTLSKAPEDEQFVFVTINGVQQQVDAYGLSNTTLIFNEAPPNGVDIEVRTFTIRSSDVEIKDYKSYVYTISGTTSTISGVDDFGATLEFDNDKVEVYYNGVRLVQGPDYGTTGNTQIDLNASVDDGTIEVVSLSTVSFIDNNAIAPYSAGLSTTAPNQFVDKFRIDEYRSAKYFVQMTANNEYHTTEVMVLHNGTDVYLTEYGTMYTNNSLGTVSADILNGYVRLLVSPTANSTVVKGHKITVTV